MISQLQTTQLDSIDVLPRNTNWAAAWTKSRAEKALVEYLKTRSVSTFLPLVSRRHVYSSAVRQYDVPLFPGYVFFDQSNISRSEVFESRKVAQILNTPEPLALANELEQIAMALRHDPSLREARFGQMGIPVVLARGPMKGLRGDLVRMGNASRLIVRVTFLGKAAELDIDEAFVEPSH